ncbi:MAG: aminotransferase class III-fold pyridoxal phosphate-dependent enzyme, partial [Burkholderiales bacterium]|nr:aminotransferase class III-fold pyridoxal phosphate-dependent enzyme [Burkholderiales bacterium]
IAEPVMGAGGVIVPPATYFEKIQAVVRRYDMLMIADEVICGFGRTGNMFGSQTFGIRPDIMVIAKALSSAYLPISGVLVSDAVYQVLADNTSRIGMFGHGFTYSGHPVPAAVALATQKIYDSDRIGEHVQAVAPRFQQRLRALGEHPLVGEARGVSLIGAIELVKDKKTRQSFDPKLKLGAWATNQAIEHGLIARSLANDTIALCPPLIIDESQIDEMFDRMGRALDDTQRHLATV